MKGFKFFSLGLILGIGLTWAWFSFSEKKEISPPAFPVLAAPGQQPPYAVIYDFYQALAAGRQEQVAALVTREFKAALKYNSLLQKWQQSRQQDPTLRFVFFLITEQDFDLKAGTARVRGSAEWVSSRQGTLSVPQTIFILNEEGAWKIQDINEHG
ncbi:hypothetical protein [Moorella sulfitireducens (nom. illeg.)]|uniref:hypothetical protein n=1 Tax=Neomoorella sulfitireducens TaxID=2972948 RepID=UPI0021ACCC8B|nr:hypothetical protein [Moorella sulfitireducens]